MERWSPYLILGIITLVLATTVASCKPTNMITVESASPTNPPEVDPYPNLVITVYNSLPEASPSSWELSLEWSVSEPVVLEVEYSTNAGLSWIAMATVASEDMYELFFTPQTLGLPEGPIQFRLRTGSKVASIGSVFIDDTPPDLTPSSPIYENVCYNPGGPYQIDLSSATDNSPLTISYTPTVEPGYGILDCYSQPGSCFFHLYPEDFELQQNFSFSYIANDAAGNTSSQENVVEFSFIECGP